MKPETPRPAARDPDTPTPRTPHPDTPPAPSGPDLAELVARFGVALRAAGAPVTAEQTGRLAASIVLAPPTRPAELYWLARVTLVADAGALDTFDRVFARVFAGLADPAEWRGQDAPRPRDVRRRTPSARSPALAPPTASPPSAGPAPPALDAGGDNDSEESDRRALLAAASPAERLRHRDFASLDDDELRELRALTASIAFATPTRPGRRRTRSGRGEEIDLRATLRAARRSGGEPVRPVGRRRRRRPRRLVLLCDVSASMEPYARAYLQLLLGGVGGAGAEAFLFATRLTRVTRVLRDRHPDAALDRAGRAAPDWSGGTRLGEALRVFNDEHGRRGVARGAVVVILSDGWDRGDPALLDREMGRLRRLAHRVVWVNPRKARPGYQPLAGGMAAALPHLDAFLAGADLASFEEVLAMIGAARREDRR